MSEPTAETLLAGLDAPGRSEQRSACDAAIERVRRDAGFRRELLDRLRTGSPRTRFAVAYVLFRTETPTLRLLPPLLEALDLGDGDLRWSAAHMLATLGRLQPEVLPVLLDDVRASESPIRRRMAVYVVRELGPERPETRAALLSALDDPDLDVRRAALSSLAKLREPERADLDRVLRALEEDPDPRMRRIAAIVVPSLTGGDPSAREIARAALERAGQSGDTALSRAASAALERLS